MAETCSNCRFWGYPSEHREHASSRSAACRRIAPTPLWQPSSGIVSVFSQVFGNQWCGEWQAHANEIAHGRLTERWQHRVVKQLGPGAPDKNARFIERLRIVDGRVETDWNFPKVVINPDGNIWTPRHDAIVKALITALNAAEDQD